MSLKAKNDPRARRQQQFLGFIGILMIVSMMFSLLLPLLQTMERNSAAVQPTPSQAPTVPAPVASLDSIQFDQTYLHPSGLYTVAIPTGWVPTGSNTTETEAQVTMQNGSQLSVTEVRVIKPTEPVTDTAGMSAYFTDAWIKQSWSTYSNAVESVRNIEDNRVVIDFTMQQGAQQYIARQISTTDGTYIYVTRVVTPPNASDMLRYVLEHEAGSIKIMPEFAGEPFGWTSYYDTTAKHILRFPRSWTLVDGIAGLPASIQGPNLAVRVETFDGAVNSEDEAKARVQALRAGITPLTVKAIDRDGNKGYQVSYKLVNQDGDAESGAAVLINGTDGKLHLANVRLTGVADLDLNADSAAATYGEIVSVLNSFTVLSGLNVYVPTPTPVPPTPVPSA